jgi:hypothetical protein
MHLLRVYLQDAGHDTTSTQVDIQVSRGGTGPKDFYLYEVHEDTPTRLVTVGFFGINASTADIWERVGCRRVESGALVNLQRRIIADSGMRLSVLDSLTKRTPCF